MSLKFIQVPVKILEDVENGKLIPSDIHTYTYLVKTTITSGGKFIIKTELEIASELIVSNKGSSLSKVTKSLRRLREAGHINRESSFRSSKTTVLTKV
jgi:hypothetical protein